MTYPDERSEAARELNRARWGSRVAERAACVVIERAAELPAALRAEVAEAVAECEVTGDAV